MTMSQPIRACTDLGALTINDVSMHITGAWNILNPHVLWMPNAARGGNSMVSHRPGKRAKPWHLDESRYSMLLVIDGMNDWDGNPYDNPWEGLELNIEYLYETIIIPPAEPTATYDASLLMPSGDERFAEVQPKPWSDMGDASNYCINVTMPLVVPGVRFEPSAS